MAIWPRLPGITRTCGFSYDRVIVDLNTHSANGITDQDFELARKIEDTVQWRPAAGSASKATPDDPCFRYLYYD